MITHFVCVINQLLQIELSLLFQQDTSHISMNCTYKAFFIWHFKLNSVCLHVIVMSRMSSWVNLHSIVCQRTPCSKQASYLKFKRQQWDSNPQPLRSWTNTQKLKLKLVSLAKLWSVRLRTKWLLAWIPLLSLKFNVTIL